VNSQNYLTDVGAYSLATSPYGTYDQGGNVGEWNEAVIFSQDRFGNFVTTRGGRGGNWVLSSNYLFAGLRSDALPTGASEYLGFRIASIPEPSTLLLGAMASIGVLFTRRTRNG
jgi:formylglycine-generating enzyme required for sulfatase activity